MNERERRLADIREWAEAATPGPWRVSDWDHTCSFVTVVADTAEGLPLTCHPGDVIAYGGYLVAESVMPANAKFMVAALDDVPWLLAEIDLLAGENQGLRLAAVQDEGLWSSQDAGLRVEIERLTAERDAMRGDAALGALVRRMPEMLGHRYLDQSWDEGEGITFSPEWVALYQDGVWGWHVQVGEDDALWCDETFNTPELALAHVFRIAGTREATDDK